MNRKQRIVLFIMSAFIILMFLFPPYVRKAGDKLVESGYGFIFTLFSGDWQIPPTVNISLLLVQIFGVLVVGGNIWFALKHKE